MDLPADQPPGRTSAPATELGAITAELRAAVADAVDSAVPPGSGARSVGRSLGLTKTMGWKLWTLATSDDAERAVAAIPGDQGWAIMLQALASGDVPNSKVERVRAAMEAYRSAAAAVTGNDPAAGAVDRGRRPVNGERAIDRAKRDAVRAAALLTGIRARAFVAVLAVLPEGGVAMIEREEDRRLQIVRAGFVRGLERTRPGPPCPVLDGVLARVDGVDPMGQLVPELCTPGSIGRDFAAGEGDAVGAVVMRACEPQQREGVDLAFVAQAPAAAETTHGPALHVPLPCDRLDLVLVLPKAAQPPNAELRMSPTTGGGTPAGGSWVANSVCVEAAGPTEAPGAATASLDDPDAAAAARLTQSLTAREPRIAGAARSVRYSFAFPPPGAAVLLRFAPPTG